MKTINNKIKIIILCVIALMICFIGFRLVVFWGDNRIKKLDVTGISQVAPSEYMTCLDVCDWKKDADQTTKDYVIINGWALKPGMEIFEASISVVIRSTENDKYYILPTKMIQRSDLTSYMNDGYNYEKSGFSTSVAYWHKLADSEYELFLLYDLNGTGDVLIPLNAFIGGAA